MDERTNKLNNMSGLAKEQNKETNKRTNEPANERTNVKNAVRQVRGVTGDVVVTVVTGA